MKSNFYRVFAVALSVLLGATLATALASAATTISTDIQTDGALSVTGTSTLNGLVNIGGTGSSILNINNTSAINPVEIHSANAQGLQLYTHSNTGFRGPDLDFERSRGTQAAPAAVQSGDILSYLTLGGGYNGTAYVVGAQIQTVANENWTGTADGATVTFFTAVAGSNALGRTMTINNGDIGINDSNPLSRLSVGGNAQIGFGSGQTAPANGLVVSGNVGIGTTTPATKLQISSGASATTTVTIGELGLTSSKGCVNINRSDGGPGSFYLSAAGTLVSEQNYCR